MGRRHNDVPKYQSEEEGPEIQWQSNIAFSSNVRKISRIGGSIARRALPPVKEVRNLGSGTFFAPFVVIQKGPGGLGVGDPRV